MSKMSSQCAETIRELEDAANRMRIHCINSTNASQSGNVAPATAAGVSTSSTSPTDDVATVGGVPSPADAQVPATSGATAASADDVLGQVRSSLAETLLHTSLNFNDPVHAGAIASIAAEVFKKHVAEIVGAPAAKSQERPTSP